MKTTLSTVLFLVLVAATPANASRLSGNLRANNEDGQTNKFHGRQIPGLPQLMQKKLRDGRHEPKHDVGIMQLLDKAEEPKETVVDEEEQRELNNEKTTNNDQLQKHADLHHSHGGGLGGKLEAENLKHNLRYADAVNHNMNTEGMEDPANKYHHSHRQSGHIKNLLHGIHDKLPVDAEQTKNHGHK